MKRIYYLMILPPLLWAGNATIARAIADQIPPLALSFWRWAIALIILLPLTWRQTYRDRAMIKQHWRSIVVLALLGIACFNTLLYTAAHTTTAINMSLTQSIMPVFIVLISFFLFGERISWRQFCAVILCTLGAGYIIIRGDFSHLTGLRFVKGDLIMLLAVLIYALYSVLLRYRPAIHPLSFLTVTFAIGATLLLPLYLYKAASAPPWALSPTLLTCLLYVAICPSIIAYLVWNRGVQEIGASRTGLYINLLPLFTALLAVILLGEHFQHFHSTGIVLIASGLLLFNLPIKPKKGF